MIRGNKTYCVQVQDGGECPNNRKRSENLYFLDIFEILVLRRFLSLYVVPNPLIILYSIHLRLDLVNLVVRLLLFIKLSLFTKSSPEKVKNMKKGVAIYSLN